MRPILFFVLLIVFSCTRKKVITHPDIFASSIFKVSSYLVPKDSIAPPEVIPVDESKLKKKHAGNPLKVPMSNNVHIAGAPKIILSGKPAIAIPGTSSFLLPQKIAAIQKSVVADMPETFLAKDMTYKVPNPSGFGSFGKLQGLKNTIVTALLQDKLGNTWICTASGVSKYDGHSFTNFTTREGLVYNDVRAIMQDRNGNIWFGTLGGGISKYDGYSFTNFTAKEGLCNNYVLSIAEDSFGNIWFASFGGVSKYDGHSFTNFTQKQGLVNDSVEAVIKDKSGNLWFGTCGGLSKYDGSSFTNYAKAEGLSNNNVYTIFQDRADRLWLGTIGGGISLFDGNKFVNFTENDGMVSNEVFSLFEDMSGNVWIGTHDGLSKFDGKSFTNFTEADGLTNANIYCIMQDNSHNIWLGTGGGGVLKYIPNSFTHITEARGLKKNYTFSLCEDKKKNIWIGSWRGGVAKYEGDYLKIFTKQHGLPDNDIRNICEDKSGNFWFATYKGVAKYDGKSFTNYTHKQGLINDDVICIKEDKAGNIWFGSVAGVSKYDGRAFTNFTHKQGLINDDVNCIKEDKAGNIWFATTGGVTKYDGISFTQFSQKNLFGNFSFVSILEDKQGNFWWGTSGGGLFKYDGKSVARYSEKEGLINDDISSLLQDTSGNIWIGTRFGLSKLPYTKLSRLYKKVPSNTISGNDIFFENYGYADGFLGIGCTAGCILQSANGNIWIGTNDGTTFFNPTKKIQDTTPPNIQITSLKLFNETIDWNKLQQMKDTSFFLSNGISLSNYSFKGLNRWYHLPMDLHLAYYDNYIGFDFIGISMNHPQNIKYQYQLEGIDKTMSALTTQPNAAYANLQPGVYTFRVKAMSSEGYWSNEIKYRFTILPPWWQTWWCRILEIIAGLTIIFFTARFIYIYSLRKQKILLEKQLAVQYERQRISSDLHDDIGSTLSSINIYAGLAKKDNTEPLYLESISRNVNEVISKLDDLVWSIKPGHDTFGNITERLSAFAEPPAKTKEINFNITIAEHLKELKLAAGVKHHLYMITKELINNALKHSACKNINVDISGGNKELTLVITDDGKGFEQHTMRKGRNGIQNIAERVNKMNGNLNIQSGIGNGTIVRVNIPV